MPAVLETPVSAGISGVASMATDDDRARFEALVTAHLDELYGTGLRLTRNRAAAEDLVQETFLKAWRSFRTFQTGSNGRAWLYRILMNAHIDSHRRASRTPEILADDEGGNFSLYARAREGATAAREGNPEEILLAKIMDADVASALEQIPEMFRAAVILADLQEFSYREIAEILDIPIGTVMSRLYRGRRLLQRLLWDRARRGGYGNGAMAGAQD